MKKYSLLFLILIILIKIIYLFFESHYNGQLIDVVSDPNVTKDMMNKIEQYGHRLSAIGLTLLFTPFLYKVFKKYFNEIKTFAFIIVLSIGIYNIFYFSLNALIDVVIEKNKDKRYSSYYTTIFKYGMLNNKMGYGSFIPNDRLINPTIEDKVMISNMFLLAFLDPELIDRLIKNKDHMTDAYISRYSFDEYKKAEQEFNKKVQEINDLYKEYLEENKKINEKFSKNDNVIVMNSEYQQFKNNLYIKYGEYIKQSKKYLASRNPTNSKISEYKSELSKYFKYKNMSQAQNKYKAKMNQEFGYYIDPDRWCQGNQCPAESSIRKVIAQEADQKWKKAMGKIEPNLDQLKFFKHAEVRKQVVDELRKNGLNVSSNFDYSRDAFFEAYRNKLLQEYGNIDKSFQDKFKEKFNKNIGMGLNYQQFTSFWKDDLTKEYGEKHGTILLSMIQEKDTENFYNDFFILYFQDKYLGDYLLTREQLDEDKHKSKGDDAIKSLFVVPFAIGMSLFSGLLNLVSVVSLILIVIFRFIPVSEKKFAVIALFTKIVMLAVIIYIPYRIGNANKVIEPYKVIKDIDNSKFVKKYSEILKWILVCEKINYEKVYEKFMKK